MLVHERRDVDGRAQDIQQRARALADASPAAVRQVLLEQHWLAVAVVIEPLPQASTMAIRYSGRQLCVFPIQDLPEDGLWFGRIENKARFTRQQGLSEDSKDGTAPGE